MKDRPGASLQLTVATYAQCENQLDLRLRLTPDWIALDMAQSRPQMRLSHRAREKPVLPQRPAALPPRVQILRTPPVRPTQSHRQPIFLIRNDYQVNVVRHKAVGQHSQARLQTVFSQQSEIHLTVAPGVEDDLPAGAALRHMVRHARRYDSSCSRYSEYSFPLCSASK